MFRDSIDGWNFQLRDHTSVKGLKALACYKRGLCGGHKPFICRTHPFYFENSHLMFQKSWCRLSVERYMALHSHAVMRLQSIVEKFGLRDTSLGHDQRDYVFAEQHKMPPPD
jgi:hypothetical protein